MKRRPQASGCYFSSPPAINIDPPPNMSSTFTPLPATVTPPPFILIVAILIHLAIILIVCVGTILHVGFLIAGPCDSS
ncbi:hypothetical protein RIF29_13213 [Crotalaria pallida]|uniref:Transmembrane protein n=1 Tax=Crotalaria pallida TaxID=3830 RepID=A0AAN9P1Q7_CROPI